MERESQRVILSHFSATRMFVYLCPTEHRQSDGVLAPYELHQLQCSVGTNPLACRAFARVSAYEYVWRTAASHHQVQNERKI